MTTDATDDSVLPRMHRRRKSACGPSSTPCAASTGVTRRESGSSSIRIAGQQTSLTTLSAQNDRLSRTLKCRARAQIVNLRAEVDRLAQPPNGYGVVLEVTLVAPPTSSPLGARCALR